MSDFVNFQKRSVALPGGCKDLMDVLRRPAEEQPTVTRGQRSDGGVRQVATYLGRLFESRSELATLMISSADENLTAMFYLRGGGQAFVLILIASDPALEAAVRGFYAKRGIQPVQTYPIPNKRAAGSVGIGVPDAIALNRDGAPDWRVAQSPQQRGPRGRTALSLLSTRARDGLK
jgi:hypothetical protein